MLLELITKIIHCDAILARLDSISKECLSKIINLVLIKLHPILCHTRLDNLPQLCLVNLSITWREGENEKVLYIVLPTIRVIHLEQEREFLLLPLVSKLMHSLKELFKRDCATSILVKNTKSPLNKKFLKNLIKYFDVKLLSLYILGRYNLFEFLESELFLTFSNIVSEHLLQPGNVFLGKSSILTATKQDNPSHHFLSFYSHSLLVMATMKAMNSSTV